MALKKLFRKARELTMSHEARIEAAFREAVPAEMREMLFGGGAGEAGLVADSLALFTGLDSQKGAVEDLTALLTIYVQVVNGYLMEGKPLHDIRAELLRRYEAFLRVENIGRVTAFCILHAGDGTFFMTNADAEEQLSAMLESMDSP